MEAARARMGFGGVYDSMWGRKPERNGLLTVQAVSRGGGGPLGVIDFYSSTLWYMAVHCSVS